MVIDSRKGLTLKWGGWGWSCSGGLDWEWGILLSLVVVGMSIFLFIMFNMALDS